MKVEIQTVWKKVTPALGEELMAFWRNNKAIVDDTAAAKRATQAVCIVRDVEGAICGVGTAVIKVLPRLRQPMYYYRQFFAKSMRGKHQELAFFKHAKQALQDYNATLGKTESLGILLEIENAKIIASYKRAHEQGFDATFIGYSPRGLQLRVSYFEGAELMPPAPVRGPVAAARTANQHNEPSSTQTTTRRTSDRS